nr:MAG TPA: hypothetical protein [Caudoviricetes sp.]
MEPKRPTPRSAAAAAAADTPASGVPGAARSLAPVQTATG